MRTNKLKYLSGTFIVLFVLFLISCESGESKFTDKGIEHLSLKEYKLAIDDFNAALKENPDFNDAYFLRAYAYYESAESMEEVNLATKDFTAYIENNQVAGLASYVCTNSMELANKTSEALETGMVAVNTPFISNAETPFGGIKQSGYGREGGSFGIKDYLNIKFTHIGISG